MKLNIDTEGRTIEIQAGQEIDVAKLHRWLDERDMTNGWKITTHDPEIEESTEPFTWTRNIDSEFWQHIPPPSCTCGGNCKCKK